jgi:NTE family protein
MMSAGVLPDSKEPLTLRHILMDAETGFHLAMAPAFFGFYGYFGALAAWEDVTAGSSSSSSSSSGYATSTPIRSVAGASAGAMAAILVAAGISPHAAADFCEGITVRKFADFPGFGGVFKGNKFERIMHDFLLSSSTSSATNTSSSILRLEDAILPVAVSAFDLQTLQGKVLQTGSMARAARASATFPGLFQPVGWHDERSDYLFIDGGIADSAGILGLTKTIEKGLEQSELPNRVINLCVGRFLTSSPPGPSSLPGSPQVISIQLLGLPQPGPWAMQNGPKAFQAAREAMIAALDEPLQRVVRNGRTRESSNKESHYVLSIDASSFRT